MGFLERWRRRERLIGIDIGASTVKIVELSLGSGRPELVRLAVIPVRGDIFSSNSIAKPDRIAPDIAQAIEAHGMGERRAVTAVPAPSVFMKKMRVPSLSAVELEPNVRLEAANIIPHKIDAVKLDFQVVGRQSSGELDVLLVAVKNEIVDSFTGCLNSAGVDTAIVDVDLFALQNIFELARPDLVSSTVALINIGARYSGVVICAGGCTLLTGDVPLGGRSCTEAIAQGLSIPIERAEELKCGAAAEESAAEVRRITAEWTTQAAHELNRKLSFFWNTSGAAGRIERILVSGGGSEVAGLVEAIAAKTEVPCERLEPLRAVECDRYFDQNLLATAGSSLAVALGLAVRQPGDKPSAETQA
jgi:type IV pilus assembly protein PilM